MFPNNKRTVVFIVVALIWLTGTYSTTVFAQQAKKPLTVAGEIELALFIPNMGVPNTRFSPDGSFFAVYSERGRLDLNGAEDSLRFYSSQVVQNFLKHSDESQPPSPVWVVNRSDKTGPVITDWRWLADSTGVAFLERTSSGHQRLVVADLEKKMVEPLTSTSQNVEAFDIRDRNHYVYTAVDPVVENKQVERQAPAIVGTGRSLFELLLPDDPITGLIDSPRKSLWAVVGSRHIEVKKNDAPIAAEVYLSLSPDGNSLVTIVSVPDAPSSWETLYPQSLASSAYRIHPGRAASQFVRIDLQTGSVQSLTDAPISGSAGWWAYGNPSWSSDGQEILLPGTFLKSKDQTPSRPCVALVDLPSNTRTCVEVLKGQTETGVEEGYHTVMGARFASEDKQRIMVIFTNSDGSFGTTEYHCTADGIWQVAGQSKGVSEVGHDGFEVTVKQRFDEPPLLIASSKETSRVIWDPNPQLKNIELGQASVYKWNDREGRERRGGLFGPSNYKTGQRYPLVIQTHGFDESLFLPSGNGFPTGFAARVLAAAGIVVLQVGEPCPEATPSEGPCAVSGYEAAVNQLVSEGLVDPGKIGIIGFSRTCFYVMEALTTGLLHLKAASVTDGVMFDYFQYILQSERLGPEYNSIIGASPFGDGLQQWLKRSPGFNLDKISTPLLIVAEGRRSLLFMWEPYAGLRYLHKPVDLILLNTDEHVLTNPAVRMASQGGSVDWFRFWLEDEEDPDPAKAEQYARWRELRKLQEANDANAKAAKEKTAPVN